MLTPQDAKHRSRYRITDPDEPNLAELERARMYEKAYADAVAFLRPYGDRMVKGVEICRHIGVSPVVLGTVAYRHPSVFAIDELRDYANGHPLSYGLKRSFLGLPDPHEQRAKEQSARLYALGYRL